MNRVEGGKEKEKIYFYKNIFIYKIETVFAEFSVCARTITYISFRRFHTNCTFKIFLLLDICIFKHYIFQRIYLNMQYYI